MKSNLSMLELPRISLREFAIARQESVASALKMRLAHALNSRQISSLRDLKIHVCDGEVTISGKVDSYYHRQVAVNSCLNTWGMRKLIDQIEVHSGKD